MRVRGTRVLLPSAGTSELMSWHNVMYDILIRVLILSDVRPVTKEVPSPPGIITREPCMLPAVATLTAGLYRWAIDAPHLAQTV